jgi:hypothetical protein
MSDKKSWEDIENLPIDMDYKWDAGDKRKNERIDIKVLRRLTVDGIVNIEVEIIYGQKKSVRGILKDLSRGGAKIFLPLSLPFKDEAKVGLKFSIGTRQINVNGVLRWCKQEDVGYCVGLQFIDLNPADASFLTSLYITLSYK